MTTKKRMRMKMMRVSNKIVIDLAPKITFVLFLKEDLSRILTFVFQDKPIPTFESEAAVNEAKMQKGGVGTISINEKWTSLTNICS